MTPRVLEVKLRCSIATSLPSTERPLACIMGREESAAQAKEAARAKEAAAAAKKAASRDKQWEVGAKPTDTEAAAKAAEAAARAAAKKAQELAEGGGAPVVKPGVVLPRCAHPALPPPPRLVLTCCPRLRRCKLCKKPYDPKKGCPC